MVEPELAAQQVACVIHADGSMTFVEWKQPKEFEWTPPEDAIHVTRGQAQATIYR